VSQQRAEIERLRAERDEEINRRKTEEAKVEALRSAREAAEAKGGDDE